jgi:hypothetical protein
VTPPALEAVLAYTLDVPLHWEWKTSRVAHWIIETIGAQKVTANQSEALVRIVLHAIHERSIANRWIHYPRAKGSPSWQLKKPFYTYWSVVPAVNWLAERGFIESEIAPALGPMAKTAAMQSRLRATKKLQSLLSGLHPIKQRPGIVILLREPTTKAPLDFRVTRYLQRLEKLVDCQNDAILAADFTSRPDLQAPMHLVFTGDFNRNGRWYCIGQSWQNVKKIERSEIRIDGEEMCCLDFKAMHPNLAYAKTGERPFGDPYELSGHSRRDAKQALLVILNAKSRASAIKALTHPSDGQRKFKHAKAKVLVTALMAKHSKLHEAGLFFGSGLILVREESKVTTGVVRDMLSEDILVLPIHDGYMVKRKHMEFLRQSMVKHSLLIAGFEFEISQET